MQFINAKKGEAFAKTLCAHVDCKFYMPKVLTDSKTDGFMRLHNFLDQF